MVTEVQIRKIALALPGAFEHSSHDGRPSWRTKPRMFAWIRPDPEALVIWVESLDAKEAMIALDPETFFTTPHYDGYAMVLVRLGAIERARAAELIGESWRLRAPASLTRRAAGSEPSSRTRKRGKGKPAARG